jgi:hypothetical protein
MQCAPTEEQEATMFWAGLAIGFIIGMALLAILWFIFIGKINI